MAEIQTQPAVPIEYAGKWIAWDFHETKIVASGNSYEEPSGLLLRRGKRGRSLIKRPMLRLDSLAATDEMGVPSIFG
jgi:hypothetical protein